MFSVSFLWGDLDLSNDLPLSDLLLMDLSPFLFDSCGLSVMLTVSILFFEMGRVMDYLTPLGFSHAINPLFDKFSVVVTNDFLEDMIFMLDLIYLYYYKTKVILPAI